MSAFSLKVGQVFLFGRTRIPCLKLSLWQEDKDEEDGKKGKKKKFKVMETIKEETLSALRAFLTERGDDEAV